MSATLDALARRQHGAFTLEQAASAGYDAGLVQRRLLEHSWLPVLDGVVRAAGTPLTEQLLAWAAVLAVGPPVAVAGATAARVHRLDRVPRPPRPTLVVPWRRCRAGVAGVEVRRVQRFSLVYRHGLPLTPIPETVRDLGASLPHADLRDVVHHALLRRRCDLPALWSSLGGGRAGSAALRSVLREVDPGYQVHWERLLDRALVAADLRLRPQQPVYAPGRPAPVAFCDLGLEALRFGVEIDGYVNHMLRFRADRRRQRLLAVRLGWLIAPYAVEDLADDLDAVVAEVVASARARAAQLGVPWPGTALPTRGGGGGT